MKRRAVDTLFFLIALQGCSFRPQIKNFMMAESLDLRDLKRQGVAVVGLIGDDTGLLDRERKKLNLALYRTLESRLGPEKVWNWDLPAEETRSKDIAAIMASDPGGRVFVSLDSRGCATPTLPDSHRFFLFFSIKDDRVTKDPIQEKEKDGKAEACFTTSRHVELSMSLYDSDARAVAWAGDLSNTDNNERCNSRTRLDPEWVKEASFGQILAGSLITGLADGIGDAILGTYPSPPGLVRMASPIFRGYMANLEPRPEASKIPQPPSTPLSIEGGAGQ